MDLRKKIVLIGALQLILLSGVLFALYYRDAKTRIEQQYVEKARSVVLTTESAREEMGRKWEQGIFNADSVRAWADAGKMDHVIAVVPVVAAWRAAMAKADEGGYAFKTPKFHPRNPQNEPDELEARVLKMFEESDLTEHYEHDPKANAIRYFRPIRLTEECLLCHGDPATASSLWGNDAGLDPTGAKMENWKVGEVHGAFEVIQSLDQADAAVAAALWQGAGTVGALVIVASVIFFSMVTRGVVRPIHRIIHELNAGADQVNDASAAVASASQALAAGASEQASSLEQTSSSLEEMSARTRASAESAAKANESATRARTSADRGDQTMRQLNTAVSAINQSSSEISKIIKVIEEIAFQTNLLALNAAVEAARAGEHGKGFAVVAEEVRNLAQRSAQAARDTTTLIAASVERAREGGEVATSASDALRTIIGDVATVAELLSGISRASNEQAQGVEQINAAVSQMDRITQQNAAGAEESSSAAEQLSAQAESVKATVSELVRLVGGDSKPAVAAARPAPKPRAAPRKPAARPSAPPRATTPAAPPAASFADSADAFDSF